MGATRSLITIRYASGHIVYINDPVCAEKFVLSINLGKVECEAIQSAPDVDLSQRLGVIEASLKVQRELACGEELPCLAGAISALRALNSANNQAKHLLVPAVPASRQASSPAAPRGIVLESLPSAGSDVSCLSPESGPEICSDFSADEPEVIPKGGTSTESKAQDFVKREIAHVPVTYGGKRPGGVNTSAFSDMDEVDADALLQSLSAKELRAFLSSVSQPTRGSKQVLAERCLASIREICTS